MSGRALASVVTALLLLAQGATAQVFAPRPAPPPSPRAPAPPRSGTPAPPPVAPVRPDNSLPGPRPPMPVFPGGPFQAGPLTYAPRYTPRYGRWSGGLGGRLRHPFGWAPAPGYWPWFPDPPEMLVAPRPQGRLALQVTPGSAEVFVDGFYLGRVQELQERGLWMDAGPRRIEFRADGFDTVTFDVRVPEGQTIEYLRDLTRTVTRTAEAGPPARPKTFYVIPGCYAGDNRPRADQLPGGCSVANVREIPPLVSAITPR